MLCLPSLGSCAGACLGSMACCALTKGNTDDWRVSKFLAMFMQAMSVAIILVVQTYSPSSWLTKFKGINACDSADISIHPDAVNDCYAQQIAYRIGFATACVFAFHLALSFFGRCMANKTLNSFWIFKFVFVIVGSVLFCFIPNSFFNVWGGIASVVLGWFLLVQMVWLIDFGFGWNDLWVTNAAEDRRAGKSGKGWLIGILIFAAGFLAGAYSWYGVMFNKYASIDSNRAILGVNVGVSTGLGLVSVFSPRGGILPASLVVLYIAWLSWSTVMSGDATIVNDTQLGVGLAIAAVVMIYSTMKAKLPETASAPAEQKNETSTSAESTPAEAIPAIPAQQAMEEGGPATPQKDAPPANVGSWRYIFFINSMHLSAACYLMILTMSWSKSPLGTDNKISYWVQAVAAWVMLLLYGWTLIAPLICANRDF